jgi:hypothetical protein
MWGTVKHMTEPEIRRGLCLRVAMIMLCTIDVVKRKIYRFTIDKIDHTSCVASTPCMAGMILADGREGNRSKDQVKGWLDAGDARAVIARK